MMKWKIKCLDMINVPLLLLKEMEDEVKKAQCRDTVQE